MTVEKEGLTAAASAAPSRKIELRQELKARLATLDAEAARLAGQQMAEHLWWLPEMQAARGVLSCLSFGGEIDTWPLVDRLLAAGKKVYVPRAEPRDHSLRLHRYPCPLKTLSFGLRQPPRKTPELPPEAVGDEVDVVLVLGLGFDYRGYRLGYGSGYFDRFLARYPLTAIGLAYQVQLVDALPNEPHDVPMAAVVTEQGVWRASLPVPPPTA